MDMRNAGVRPGVVTYGSLIDAYARADDETRVRELFTEMEADGMVGG